MPEQPPKNAAGDQPKVILSFDVHWCPRHLRPFRARWPHGTAVAMIELLQAAVAMPAISAACPVTDDGKADAAYLDEALRRFAPLCCFITADARAAIYRKAGVIAL